MNESDIIYQDGPYWVGRSAHDYTVFRDGSIVARADSSYPRTEDGKSIAIARAKYLAKVKR